MNEPAALAPRGHLRAGWLALLVAAAAGLALEALMGLRSPFYMDLDVESRRDLWRLAHAHLALVGLVHLAFALSARVVPRLARAKMSSLLLYAAFLMPLGFWLGGAFLAGSEPGPLVLLAPVGGVAFVGALSGAAFATLRAG